MIRKRYKDRFRRWLREAFEKVYPTPRWVVYTLDLLVAAFAVIMAWMFTSGFRTGAIDQDTLLFSIVYIVFVRASVFLLTASFSNVIRLTGSRDILFNLKVISYGTLVLLFFNTTGGLVRDPVIPTAVILLEFFISSVLLNGYRLLIGKIYFDLLNPARERSNVIIYGSDRHAFSIKKAIESDSLLRMKAVAFIDNGNNNAGCQIDGVDIINLHDLPASFYSRKADAVIIPALTTSYHVKEFIVDRCLEHDVRLMPIPDVRFWIGGQLVYDPVENLDVDDLLERDPIHLDMRQIKNQLTGKTILVTGAAGSIGSEIVRQLIPFRPAKLIFFDQDESALYALDLSLREEYRFFRFETAMGNISDGYRVEKLFRTYRPDIVFHAAAYKHVPMMEANAYEAVRVNVQGTKNLADMAVKYGAGKFVMISTDKAVRPTNVMGATKRIAEMYVQSMNQQGDTIFITTRFGNVLGSNGSVIPTFLKQLREKGELTVTHPEITRFFMSIPEACQLVLEAGAMGKTGEIFIFDMGKPVKINDLACRLINLCGKIPGKEIPIRYSGLRPGEKLYEELLYDREKTLPTHNPKIMIAKTEPRRYSDISDEVDHLISLLGRNSTMEMVAEMKRIVTDYQSLNSEFEKLDKPAPDTEPETEKETAKQTFQ